MDRRSFISSAILAAAATAFAAPAFAAPAPRVRAATDPRVDALLARMTSSRKIALIRCDFASLSGLGIPALTMADASAGIRGETGVTAFPVPIAQAATFNPALLTRLGAAIADEGRGKGFNTLLGPTIDLARTWHSGRFAETLGEDPFLAGTAGTSLTTAMWQRHTATTVKHFAAYTQENSRFFLDEKVSDRALHEVYEAPFRDVIAALPQTSVMIAYPKINGTFATQNPTLFTDLKNVLGLQGYTVPDFWAGDDQVAAARAGMDLAGLGAAGVRVTADQLAQLPAARIDDAARRILTTMYGAGLFDHPVPAPAANVSTADHQALAHEAAVHSTVLLTNSAGALPFGSAVKSIAVIGPAGDAALTGVSGSSYVNPGDWTSPIEAIRARAGSSVRVVESPGSLGDVPLPVVPATVLRTSGGTAGLTGTFYAGATPTGPVIATATQPTLDFAAAPVAGLPDVWSARWTGTLIPTVTGLHRFSLLASGTATLTVNGQTVATGTRHSRQFFLGPYDYPLHGTIQLTAGRAVPITVEYTNSSGTAGESYLVLGWQPDSPIPAAVTAARGTDAAVVVVNRVAGEDMDHDSLDLPGDQNQLIAAVAAANPNTVVVLNTDGPVTMPWLSSVRAVLQAWYGGRGMGTALAAILFGDADPAGRLPVTFPATAAQGPGATPATYPGVNATVTFAEDIHIGHRFYDRNNQTPLFPFGHGLSYSTFAVGELAATYNATTRTLTATVTVTNTGTRTGWQTVQLYAGLPTTANAEVRRLVGFAKVNLAPGGRTQLTITVPARALSTWDTASSSWLLPHGTYTLWAGTSSRSLPVQRRVTLS